MISTHGRAGLTVWFGESNKSETPKTISFPGAPQAMEFFSFACSCAVASGPDEKPSMIQAAAAATSRVPFPHRGRGAHFRFLASGLKPFWRHIGERVSELRLLLLEGGD